MTRRVRLTHAERRLQTRERVLSAALEVFEEHGYAESSLEEIAERAGYTRKAIYSNFSGKGELLLEIMERRFQEHIDRVESIVGQGDSSARQAIDIGSVFSAYFSTERAWEKLFHEFCSVASRDEEIGVRFRPRVRDLKQALVRLVEEETRRNGIELTVPAERLVLGISALFSGISLEKLIDPEGTDDALFGETLALIAASAIKA